MNLKLINIINIERRRCLYFFVTKTDSLKIRESSYATELPLEVNDPDFEYPFNIVRLNRWQGKHKEFEYFPYHLMYQTLGSTPEGAPDTTEDTVALNVIIARRNEFSVVANNSNKYFA